jgi:hypothetical protein
MNRLPALLLLCASCSAHAIVIRHDVDDARYRVAPSEFPALADIPGEGHGILIAPRWVVTAAHVLPAHALDQVSIAGVPRRVERVVVYPGYEKLPDALVQQSLASGDATPAMAHLAASDDIALVLLAEPVADVAPAPLYAGSDEIGQQVKLVGKGGTGNGLEGMGQHSPHRTELRRAFNTVVDADERWLSLRFDAGDAGLALEGVGGDGDSGGPVLVEVDGEWRVAGLFSWKRVEGPLADFRTGTYGQTSYSLRVARYAAWIDSVMASERPGATATP